MSWEDKKLGELTLYVKRGISPKYVLENGIPIVNQRCIRENTINFDTARLSSKDKKITGVKFLQVGDTLINSTGVGTLGRTAYVKKLDQPSSSDTHVTIVRPNKIIIDSKYLSLYLNAKEDIIENMGKGATGQTELSAKDLSSLNVFYPKSLQTQKRIADILSTYDDLIENNLKRIKLLEQAAQNIYKEWFVNLRFPGHENTPINEETGLPEGWEEKPLGDIISKLESGSRPKGGIDKSLKKGVPSIGAESVRGLGYFDFSKTKYIKEVFFGKMRKGVIEDRDILIYKDGAYIGRSTLFQDNFPFEKCSINEHIFLIHAKNELLQYYLYFTLHSSLYFEKMQSLNSNAAQPGINQKKIKTLPIIYPSSNLLIKFDSMVIPMVSEIYKLAKMNLKLKTGRDILLPRLMNRTIEV